MKRGKISNIQMALESYARKSNLYPWYLCKQKKKRKMQYKKKSKSSQKLSAASEKSGTVSPHLNDGLYALLGIYPFFHAVR